MIKQIQTPRPVQTPVAFSQNSARKAPVSPFNQQFYGVLTPNPNSAAKTKAAPVPAAKTSPAASSTMGSSQNNGTAATARQPVATVATSTKGPIPAGVTPRASTPAVSVPATAAATSTTTSTPTIELTPDGKPLPPSLGFIHIIQPKIETPAATSAPVPKNEFERYWASQPKAVQELKDIEDPTARKLKAWDLANQGYIIDVPIMVWEWDPQYTMELRKSYGYTWVPSALQDTVKIAPGLQMPGVTPYDPNKPPPGSIIVNTDFV